MQGTYVSWQIAPNHGLQELTHSKGAFSTGEDQNTQ